MIRAHFFRWKGEWVATRLPFIRQSQIFPGMAIGTFGTGSTVRQAYSSLLLSILFSGEIV